MSPEKYNTTLKPSCRFLSYIDIQLSLLMYSYRLSKNPNCRDSNPVVAPPHTHIALKREVWCMHAKANDKQGLGHFCPWPRCRRMGIQRLTDHIIPLWKVRKKSLQKCTYSLQKTSIYTWKPWRQFWLKHYISMFIPYEKNVPIRRSHRSTTKFMTEHTLQ